MLHKVCGDGGTEIITLSPAPPSFSVFHAFLCEIQVIGKLGGAGDKATKIT